MEVILRLRMARSTDDFVSKNMSLFFEVYLVVGKRAQVSHLSRLKDVEQLDVYSVNVGQLRVTQCRIDHTRSSYKVILYVLQNPTASCAAFYEVGFRRRKHLTSALCSILLLPCLRSFRPTRSS